MISFAGEWKIGEMIRAALHHYADNLMRRSRAIPLASSLRYDQLLAYIAERPTHSIVEIGVARAANTMQMLAFAN